VLQSVHLRCPNAWLNHRQRPSQFLDIIRENPQIKLWFSGHDHLGHGYADSIAQYDHCVAVHTGVIGPVSRDGARQSRFVEFNAEGWTLSTIDHRTGRRTPDARHDYATQQTERLAEIVEPDESIHFAPPPMPTDAKRVQIDQTVFTIHRGMVVEFDAELSAPVGVVCEVSDGEKLRIRGHELHVVAGSKKSRVFTPDAEGLYGAIFAPNTWRGRLRSA
ncbi:MAG TPA: hypothetical protein VHV77_16150, partial [Pirellulales bacterium]|jgi:hypothetical protein|nr:hypothetical protein [Pirellulales bacterium]